MSARDVKPHKAKALKTKNAKVQRKTSTPNSSKTPPSTAVNVSLSEQEDGEDRIPPPETEDDRTPTKKNYCEDQTPPQDTDGVRTPSNKEHGEHRIPTKQQEIETIDEH